jgi:hypothetical protein
MRVTELRAYGPFGQISGQGERFVERGDVLAASLHEVGGLARPAAQDLRGNAAKS